MFITVIMGHNMFLIQAMVQLQPDRKEVLKVMVIEIFTHQNHKHWQVVPRWYDASLQLLQLAIGVPCQSIPLHHYIRNNKQWHTSILQVYIQNVSKTFRNSKASTLQCELARPKI